MATITSNIPHGSILAQLRQRQMDEFQAAEEKKRKNAAFTSELIQLGGMAAGAALAIPTGGLSLAPMMTGAGLGGAAGGLLGNAVSGTPTSMGQGINALMSVGNFANQTARTGEIADRTALGAANAGFQPVSGASPMQDMDLENSMMLGGQEYAKPYFEDTLANAQETVMNSKVPVRAVVTNGNTKYTFNSPKEDTGSSGYGVGGVTGGSSGGGLPTTKTDIKEATRIYTTGAPVTDPFEKQIYEYGDPGWERAFIRATGVDPKQLESVYGPIENKTEKRSFLGIDALAKDREYLSTPYDRGFDGGTNQTDPAGLY